MTIIIHVKLPPALQPSHYCYISANSRPNTTNTASVQLLTWIYSSIHYTKERAQLSQEQPANNVGTPTIPLCTQSEAGSFLRDRIFAKQHAHLPSDKKQEWKGSVTNTPNYQPHLWRHNNWISMPAPKGHTRQYSAKFYQTLCVPLYFWSAYPMSSQPFQLLRVNRKKQWLLSNHFPALFYIGLWWIRVLKDLKSCEVYNLVLILGTEMISFYTPLQLLGSLLSWDVKGIFAPFLIYISSH